MTDSNDYRLYLEEKFDGLRTYMDDHFELINGKLSNIEIQVTKTNGRVTDLEKYRDYAQGVIDKRPTECPNIKRFEKLEAKLEVFEQKLEDVMFFIRHPKLFIGTVVVLVILSLFAVVEGLFKII